jgi:hypothetical protein
MVINTSASWDEGDEEVLSIDFLEESLAMAGGVNPKTATLECYCQTYEN